MKSIALCACVLILASSSQSAEVKLLNHEKEANMEDNVRACMIEGNITHDDIFKAEEIIADVHSEPGNEEKRNKNGCLITCVLKKRNLMEGSSIKEEDTLAILGELYQGPDTAHDIVRKCLEEARNVEEECGKGFYLYACTMKGARARAEELEKEETEAKGDTTQSE